LPIVDLNALSGFGSAKSELIERRTEENKLKELLVAKLE